MDTWLENVAYSNPSGGGIITRKKQTELSTHYLLF